MTDTEFHKVELPIAGTLFDELFHSVTFATTGKGRLGNHLVGEDARGVPLVRTTTAYDLPAHYFGASHRRIVEAFNDTFQGAPLHVNHALIEVYDQQYTKMKYHSDQCLDVAPDSYIALFSCYEKPDTLNRAAMRKLKIRNKVTEEESEVLLTHHSVILFSVTTNAQFQHKIVLEPVRGAKPADTENRWLGITFRQSATFVQFRDGLPYFADGTPLTLATDEQRKAFFRLRGEENRSLNYTYPPLTYSISPADVIPPLPAL
ncbi:MAG TPA: hypothetical protein DCE41_24765 [Cytophagales bacterium]|nr:hypothetical protein [Cytophagales bacterium]HAP64484.1 hypothetical protein [Cytophagales bacterium]